MATSPSRMPSRDLAAEWSNYTVGDVCSEPIAPPIAADIADDKMTR